MIRVRLSSRGEHVGTVTLDANGVAVGDTGYAQGLIAETGVLEPGAVPLRPADGERYLRAMPANFDNAYFWATFYDGDLIVEAAVARVERGHRAGRLTRGLHQAGTGTSGTRNPSSEVWSWNAHLPRTNLTRVTLCATTTEHNARRVGSGNGVPMMMRPAGIEPATSRSGGERSIP